MKRKLGIALASLGFAGFIGFGLYQGYKGLPVDETDEVVADFTGDGKEDVLHWCNIGNKEYLFFFDGEYVTKRNGRYLRHGVGSPVTGLTDIRRGEYDFIPVSFGGGGGLDLAGYSRASRKDFNLHNSSRRVWLGDGKGNFSESK